MQLLRRQPVLCAALAHYSAVGEPQHTVPHLPDDRVMRDDRGRRAELTVDPPDRAEDDGTCRHVQRTGRLVAEQDVRTLGDRARDCHPLLFATGQLRREVIQPVGHANQVERVLGSKGMRCEVGDEGDVLARRQRWDEVVELEHEPHVVTPVSREARITSGGQLLVAVLHAATGRHIEAAKDVEQCGLAAPGGPQQNHELAGVERKVHPAQGLDIDLAHAVDLADPADGKYWCHCTINSRAAGCWRSAVPGRAR